MPKRYVVKQGDTFSKIAQDHGFSDPLDLWNAPENAGLRKKRSHPNVLAEGDVVTLPDRETKSDDGGTSQRHSFSVSRPPTKLAVVLQDDDGDAYAAKRYRLVVGTLDVEDRTDGRGRLEHPIAPSARAGTLQLFYDDADPAKNYLWKLRIGELDPVDEVKGVQGRLNNLGFRAGPVDGIVGRKTRAAVKAFQKSVKLEPTGEIDDATKKHLVERHDKT